MNWKNKSLLKGLRRAAALTAVISVVISGGAASAAGKDTKKSVAKKTVNVGSNISVASKAKNAAYSSSDTTVASVNGDGVVTGKKSGTAKITVKSAGKKIKAYQVQVVKKKYKPAVLPVALGEVIQTNVKMKTGSDGKVTYQARIKNNSKKGKIRKIVYHYSVYVADSGGGAGTATGDGVSVSEPDVVNLVKRTVKLSARNIGAGRKSKTVTCEGDYSGMVSGMKLVKIELYSGQACVTYKKQGDKYTFGWGTEDETAPKFSGLVKGKSTVNGDYYRIYYTDMKDKYNYSRFVTAEDERDGKVKVSVDKSGINWKKPGVYKLRFKAVDKAGNMGTSWAYAQVIIPGTAESIADTIIGQVTRKGWSESKKARAMYNYISKRTSYVSNSSHVDWRSAAVTAFRRQSGDCYSYYAMSKLLLTRAGIPNIQIKRYPVPRGMRHYWNLAYVSGGWYHFDTTPRRRAGKPSFCLMTDGQMWGYSSGYTFRFNTGLYPARAKKKISPNP